MFEKNTENVTSYLVHEQICRKIVDRKLYSIKKVKARKQRQMYNLEEKKQKQRVINKYGKQNWQMKKTTFR